MAQLRGGFRLTQKARAHVPAERQLRRQQLDRDVTLEAPVTGAVHDAHATAADLLIELVGGAERLLHVGTQFGVFGVMGGVFGHSGQ